MNAWEIFRKIENPGLPLGILLSGALYYFAFLHYMHYEPTSYITGGFYGFLELWAAIALMKKRKIRRFKIGIFDITFGVFILFILVSLGVSLGSYALPGKVKLLVFLSVFVMFPYCSARLLTIKEIGFLLWVIIGASMFAVTLVSWELIFQMRERSLSTVKYGLFGFNHASLLAGLLFGSLICVIVGYLLRPSHRVLRGALAKTGTLTLAVLLFIQTYICARGGLVAAITICLCLIFLASWVEVRKRVGLLIFLGGCIIISLQIVPVAQRTFIGKNLYWDISERNRSSLKRAEDTNNSFFVRSVLYHKAVEAFLHHPLTGVGAGRFGEMFGDAKVFPHSTLLQAFAELGAIGGLLLLSFIAFLILGLIEIFSSGQQLTIKMMTLALGSVWGFYVITDQIYGNYFMNFPFCLLSGAIGSVIIHMKEKQNAWLSQKSQ